MDKPEALLEEAARRGFLPRGARLGVAISGGRDSVALAFAARSLAPRWRWSLILFHYDHRLRPESGQDAQFVRELARRWRLPLVVGRAPRQKKNWSEARARSRRYFFLRRQARRHGVEAVLLAHHGGDQLETLLLRLFRGSGPDGLAAMAPKRGRWIRPWLSLLPEELEAYVRLHQLPYREDASNRDVRYARNVIRQKILPHLSAIHPAAWKSALQTARRLREERVYWQREARRALWDQAAEGGWRTKAMAAWPWPLFVRASQMIYERLRKEEALSRRRLLLLRPRLPERHLRTWRRMVTLGKPRAWEGPRGVRVAVTRGIFRPLPPRGLPIPPPRPVAIPGKTSWPGGVLQVRRVGKEELEALGKDPSLLADRYRVWLDLRKVKGESTVLLRAPRPGDRFTPFGEVRPRRVNQLLQREGIPPEERRRWPLLEVDGEILWVVGIRPAEMARLGEGTEEALEFRWLTLEKAYVPGMVHWSETRKQRAPEAPKEETV